MQYTNRFSKINSPLSPKIKWGLAPVAPKDTPHLPNIYERKAELSGYLDASDIWHNYWKLTILL
jgi:hypothetical protein